MDNSYGNGLSFYGSDWLWVHAAGSVAVVSGIWVCAFILLRVVLKRYFPERWHIVRTVMLVIWVVLLVLVAIDVYVLDVLLRPDLVPEWLGGQHKVY